MNKASMRLGLKFFEVILTAVLVLLLGIAFYLSANTASIQSPFGTSDALLSRQYAVLIDGVDLLANREILSGIEEQAAQHNGVVTVYPIYSEEDVAHAFEKARLTGCEGVLVKLKQNKGAKDYIQKAVQEGIHVVVIEHDAPDSMRDAYVGANPLLVGKKAAAMAIQYLNLEIRASSPRVLLILGASHQETTGISSNTYLNGFQQGLGQSKLEINMDVVYNNELATEVLIDNALRDNQVDVIVCTEPEDTLKAMNLLIDYNRISDTILIGSGQQPSILEGVNKGLIEASIVVDYHAMGAAAYMLIDALTEEKAPTAYQLMPIEVIN